MIFTFGFSVFTEKAKAEDPQINDNLLERVTTLEEEMKRLKENPVDFLNLEKLYQPPEMAENNLPINPYSICENLSQKQPVILNCQCAIYSPDAIGNIQKHIMGQTKGCGPDILSAQQNASRKCNLLNPFSVIAIYGCYVVEEET